MFIDAGGHLGIHAVAAAGQVNRKRRPGTPKQSLNQESTVGSVDDSKSVSKGSPFVAAGSGGMTSVVLAAFAALMMWAFYHPSDSTEVEQGGALGWCLSALLIVAAVQFLRVGRSILSGDREHRLQESANRKSGLLVDGIVWLLAAWIGCSAISQLYVPSGFGDEAWGIGGDWRSASNEAWVWIVGAVWFVVLRRCLRDRVNQFALLGLMVVGGVLLATHALHQVHVSLPQTLREYNADPERVLAEVGINAPEGSNARMIFENRLRDGGPTATYALANTLAGLLAMALVVVIAVLLRVFGKAFPGAVAKLRFWQSAVERESPAGDPEDDSSKHERDASLSQHVVVLAGLALAATVLALALKDTQSRAGVLSVLIVGGCVLVDFVWANAFGRRVVTALLLAISAVFAALPLAARGWFGTGWIAALPESVRYRFQYWDATWRLVEYSPWTGSGPGNYQQAYHQFRLPESHEIIADPHHFVAETFGAGGLPAGILLVALLVVGGWMIWRAECPADASSLGESSEKAAAPRSQLGVAGWCIPMGAFLGWLAVWGVGIGNQQLPDFDAHLIAIPLACAVGWLWWFKMSNASVTVEAESEVTHGETTRAFRWDVRRIAWFVLAAGLLHLSFSGGWTVPGIAVVLWTLAAIVLSPATTPPHSSAAKVTNVASGKVTETAVIAAMAGVAAVGLSMVSYRPVTESKQWMADADLQIRRGNLVGVKKLCERAMLADPHAFDPAMFRLHAMEQHWVQRVVANRSATDMEPRFKDALADAIQRAGNDPSKLQAIGELMLHRYQIGGETEVLAQAGRIYDRCQLLSPQHQGVAAQRAVIAETEGESAEAVRELAEKAVVLSESGGVVTRKLSLQFVLVVRPIGSSAIRQPVRQSAEEAMDSLRL
nr:O-antigen ligase family protein [Rhodopirellula europaea]